MSENDTSDEGRLAFWKKKWGSNQIGFHSKEVHPLLVRHFDKTFKDGKKPNRIFVPLCGKTLDMEWLANQGIETVGLDGVQTALEQFYTEHNLEWEETPVPALGTQGRLLSSKNGSYQLYCGDMLEFSSDIVGTFDVMWERGSLSALNREDVESYVQIIKDLLNPGGCILMEVVEYNISIMEDLNRPTKPPPPFPMYEEDLKKLFEPECTATFLERDASKLVGKDIHMAMYLLRKTER